MGGVGDEWMAGINLAGRIEREEREIKRRNEGKDDKNPVVMSDDDAPKG